LIKYALWYSGHHLIMRASADRALRSAIADLYAYFDAVPLDRSLRFLTAARDYVARRRFPDTRDYYLGACELAFALISELGLDLRARGEDIQLASFLLDMESIFENYVRNVLRGSPDIRAIGARVLDGNNEGRGWLFNDSRIYEARPDLILKRKSSVELIGDVKYKPKLSEQDRYQIIAHSLSFNAKRALIVLPAKSGENSKIERLGRVGTDPGVNLHVYHFNLESDDLAVEETKFCAAVGSLLSSVQTSEAPI
jgi:5-methylcytosine-specific restriction enzyme subunit McrC